MQERCLPGSGIRVSRIGLGTVQFGMDYGFTKAFTQGRVDEILSCCEARGVNLLDTARGYGDSECKIGSYLLRHPGSRFVLCTKLEKIGRDAAANEGMLRESIRRSIGESLDALGLASLPLLMLHQTDLFLIDSDRFWDAVEGLREEGLFECFGVSVYEVEDAESVLEAKRRVGFFQVPFNVFDRRFKRLAARMKDSGKLMLGRSVFLKGILTAGEAQVPAWLSAVRPHLARFQEVAARAGLSPAALALLFVLGSDCIDAAVLGVASVEELERDIETLARLGDVATTLRELGDLEVSDHSLCDPRRWPQNVFPA